MIVDKLKVVKFIPPCDQQGCDQPAQYSMTWAKEQNYCATHAQGMLVLGELMGYVAPKASIAVLTVVKR